MIQGTITWNEISKGELPPIAIHGGISMLSHPVLIAEGKSVFITQAVYDLNEQFIGWMSPAGYDYKPTHWVFINFPKVVATGTELTINLEQVKV